MTAEENASIRIQRFIRCAGQQPDRVVPGAGAHDHPLRHPRQPGNVARSNKTVPFVCSQLSGMSPLSLMREGSFIASAGFEAKKCFECGVRAFSELHLVRCCTHHSHDNYLRWLSYHCFVVRCRFERRFRLLFFVSKFQPGFQTIECQCTSSVRM